MKKRSVSLLLSAVFVFGTLPGMAHAEESTQNGVKLGAARGGYCILCRR